MEKLLTIGTQVNFNGAMFIATILEIKGKSAVLTYDPSSKQPETFTKRLSSLKPYIRQESYYDEQELAHRNAQYKDGDVAYSIIGTNGNNGTYIWKDGGIIKK